MKSFIHSFFHVTTLEDYQNLCIQIPDRNGGPPIPGHTPGTPDIYPPPYPGQPIPGQPIPGQPIPGQRPILPGPIQPQPGPIPVQPLFPGPGPYPPPVGWYRFLSLQHFPQFSHQK